MSRWFRHYAGLARDDKLVRVSIKSKQSVERVVWVWIAILESAAEIDDGGRFEVEKEEIARFLRCPASKVAAVISGLEDIGRLSEGKVAKWASRQFQSDRSAARTKAYRERHRDGDVTSQERRSDAPDNRDRVQSSEDKSSGTVVPLVDPEKVMFDTGLRYLAGCGIPESKARPQLGKWRRDHGAGAVIEALGAAQRQGVVDPMGWIEGRWRTERQSARQPVVPL
jgi:hypothetical protein